MANALMVGGWADVRMGGRPAGLVAASSRMRQARAPQVIDKSTRAVDGLVTGIVTHHFSKLCGVRA